MNQFQAKAERDSDWKEKCGCQKEPPLREELEVVATRIGQTEGEPESWQEGLRHDNQGLPIRNVLRMWRQQAHPSEEALKRQRRHSRKEQPTGERMPLAEWSGDSKRSAKERRRESE